MLSTACGLTLVGLRNEDDESGEDASVDAPFVADDAEASIDPPITGDGAIDAGTDVALDVSKDTSDGAVACTEPGGQVYAGHCYFTLSARTQPEAKTDCAAVGAHLVTVTSSGEHTFLGGVGTGDRWIGLQADAPTNDRNLYKWVTNEAKPVSYWYPNDPDNMGPCVAFRSALSPNESWVDRGCSELNVAICERQ